MTPVTAVGISVPAESTGIRVTASSRHQAQPQKPAVPQLIKSPHPDTTVASTNTTTSMQKRQRTLSGKSSPSTETVKLVPSRIVNPHVSCDVTIPTATRISESGTTGQSGTVQVIDLTRHGSSDTQVARNGISAATYHTTRSLPLGNTSEHPNQVVVGSSGKLSLRSENATSVLARNGSSTPSKGKLMAG